MFVSNKLVFLELQKTGSTHVRHLLADFVGGKVDGKHNAATPEVLATGRPILGTVRNPWSWYVSLWAYGCEGKGVLRQRLMDPAKWVRKNELQSDATGEARKVGLKGGKGRLSRAKALGASAMPDCASPERATFWYADPGNVEAFREWLSVVLAPGARRIVEAGYRRSPLSKCAGLLTYRYFGLFVRGGTHQEAEYCTVDKLNELDKASCLVSHFILNENLEADFLRAVAACGVELTDDQIAQVNSARKRNVSSRPLGTSDYYTAELAALVGDRDRFLIEKFGYKSPL